ncbi:PREDICTED: protein TIC 20-v, chloroplastic-like [Nelumbo nucifera]|uniref:Protein TIC 20 n=1 Tax=Nelumbo nucifera TaxID=4432 RepID=A0A1U7Z9X1_NELNU|nr:PREDICTED: protein TIC 20-v, chloroplastic-like [Nelumbo nucifera]
MATLLSFSGSPVVVYHRTHPTSLSSLRHSCFLTLVNPKKKLRGSFRHNRPISAQSNGGNSADTPDRLISALCYFYPFFDGIQYGKYVITQFSPIQILLQPLVPAIRVFKSFPFNGFLVFLALYFVVVRNPNFSRCPDCRLSPKPLRGKSCDFPI